MLSVYIDGVYHTGLFRQTCVSVETCFVCAGRSGSVAVVMGTVVLEESDSSSGERLIWGCYLVIYPCLVLHLLEGASSVVSPAGQHPSSWGLVSGCVLSWVRTLFWMESGSVWMSCLRH